MNTYQRAKANLEANEHDRDRPDPMVLGAIDLHMLNYHGLDRNALPVSVKRLLANLLIEIDKGSTQ